MQISNIGVSSPKNIVQPQIGGSLLHLAKFGSSKLRHCSWNHSYSESTVFSDSIFIQKCAKQSGQHSQEWQVVLWVANTIIYIHIVQNKSIFIVQLPELLILVKNWPGFCLLRITECARYKSCIFCSTCLQFTDYTHSAGHVFIIQLHMLELNVDRGRQVIEFIQLHLRFCFSASLTTLHNGCSVHRVRTLESSLVVGMLWCACLQQ